MFQKLLDKITGRTKLRSEVKYYRDYAIYFQMGLLQARGLIEYGLSNQLDVKELLSKFLDNHPEGYYYDE